MINKNTAPYDVVM